MLDIECPDRIYLNAYVPILQSSGQVVAFMTQHPGKPIPLPALMEHIGTRFRKAVGSYASSGAIPWARFGKDDRKIDVMLPYIAAQAATGKSGGAAIGVSQEFQRVWSAYQRDTKTTAPQYTFAAGIRFTELSNGFASCDGPAALQEICHQLQPGTIEVFAQRWLHRLPMPLSLADRDAGYWWEASMRRVEVSRTIVFDAPRRPAWQSSTPSSATGCSAPSWPPASPRPQRNSATPCASSTAMILTEDFYSRSRKAE